MNAATSICARGEHLALRAAWPLMPSAVCRLSERFRPALRAHFAGLSAQDVYLRFGSYRNLELLDRYVAGLDFHRSILLGVFDDRRQLAGVAHLGAQGRDFELGLSVLAGSRAHGIGTLLLRHATRHARLAGARRLYLHSIGENQFLIRLAGRFGAQFEFGSGEAEGFIALGRECRARQAVRRALHSVAWCRASPSPSPSRPPVAAG